MSTCSGIIGVTWSESCKKCFPLWSSRTCLFIMTIRTITIHNSHHCKWQFGLLIVCSTMGNTHLGIQRTWVGTGWCGGASWHQNSAWHSSASLACLHLPPDNHTSAVVGMCKPILLVLILEYCCIPIQSLTSHIFIFLISIHDENEDKNNNSCNKDDDDNDNN